MDVYSDFVEDLNNFDIVYLDDDNYLNIEQVKLSNGERIVNSSYDIEGFQGKYTYTTRKNNIFEIIISQKINLVL